MVKPISKNYDPTSWRERFLHADWGRLAALDSAYDAAREHRRDEIAAQFSKILYDIRIGQSFRSSGRGRLNKSERLLNKHIDKSTEEPLEILDIGASDGSTTAELVSALSDGSAARISAIAADRDLRLDIFRRGRWREFRTKRGDPLFATWRCWGQRLKEANLLSRLYLSKPMRQTMEHCGEISLVQPSVRNDRRIETLVMDIFEPHPELNNRFHVVRICNLLNREYFSTPQLEQAIANARGFLRPNGLLLIARNHGRAGGEDQRGGLWRLTSNGLVIIDRYGSGSEIEKLVPAQSDNRQMSATSIAP